MRACAAGAKLAICEKIPKKVVEEFVDSDKRRAHEKDGYFKMKKGVI